MNLYSKRICMVAVGGVLAGVLTADAAAQVMPYRAGSHCAAGSCGTPGSPLAGPCLPAHATFGYVPTQWRRWPVKEIHTQPAPEELPTPATLPEDNTESAQPSESSPPQLPETPPAAKSGDALSLPFGDEPSAPAFGDEPRLPMFGDEPAAAPSTADPLAAPMDDEPPAPPAESEPLPDPGTPTPAPGGAIPGFDDLGPPKLPDDDPFKDDPESAPMPGLGSGSSLNRANQQRYQRMAQHQSQQRPAAAALETAMRGEGSPDLAPSSEAPRLLHADGGTLEPSQFREEERAESNPLRTASYPVRQTSAATAAPRVAPAASVPQSGVWRRNPLRSN